MTVHTTSSADALRPESLSVSDVAACIGRHMPLYRGYKPVYQTALLRAFHKLWNPSHTRVLDIGGGTGIIAQAMKELFQIPHVESVDVHNRFLKSLDIKVQTYDGTRLPFADGSFDAIVFSNVVHHVPRSVRPALMAECVRVVGHGTIYIKDHLAASRLDHWRLTVLDAIGNVPFGGMVKAEYLESADWIHLARDPGFVIDEQISGLYRSGVFERLFPNRLEVTFRLKRARVGSPISSAASLA